MRCEQRADCMTENEGEHLPEKSGRWTWAGSKQKICKLWENGLQRGDVWREGRCGSMTPAKN